MRISFFTCREYSCFWHNKVSPYCDNCYISLGLFIFASIRWEKTENGLTDMRKRAHHYLRPTKRRTEGKYNFIHIHLLKKEKNMNVDRDVTGIGVQKLKITD